MAVQQTRLTLPAYRRGYHLITDMVAAALATLDSVKVGLVHVFVQHTSASLTINENADPSVRADFNRHFDQLCPENEPYYTHTLEGSDDMPAHLKTALLDTQLTIPVSAGKMALGTWQGIYLCEHRNQAGARHLVVTLSGE